MIDLEKYYGELDAIKLIEIIESGKEYKPEVFQYCKKRVSEMNLPIETIKSYATDIIKKNFYEYFTKGKYLSNEPINIESYYLFKKEVKKCFTESKAKFIQNRNSMTQNLNI
ncbi:hypothetical protein QSV08_12415 [Maribacter sp. BPC-D8]|uniref:hypothetical protein n=1 Tax=Maribacter sp. BPC-D8 TaxID=3053613 RepID=UPI002B459A74|nr:hypothetical protein [Maribacter sp. BPC-D8]WRI28028.1 hypothetical protein QSV08_12415 [Maribacter sp. BPC-D8]